MAMKDPQARTKQIIKDDIETIRAYADAFDVEMPDLDENGEVVGLPAPYPREVAGVVRSGYRIYELGQKALETGMPCLNPILGRNSAEETWKESNDIYKYAEKFFIQCKSYSLTSVFRLNEKLFSARHCDHHNS